MRGPSSAVLSVFRDEADFVLVPHVNPDGDAIGSCVALCLALRRRGKAAEVVCDEPIPARYAFLPGTTMVRPYRPREGRYVLVAVDCTDEYRCSCPREAISGASTVVNIDHHVSNNHFGTLQYVDDSASAAGELVFLVLQQLGWGITSDEATNLFTAISTDTGSFRFSNTTSRSLGVCSDLVRAGARPERIAAEVYETRSLPATLLLARALSSLRLDESRRIAWMTLCAADFEETGASAEDTEGIVNNARMIEGIEAGLLFQEVEDGRVRVALRSRDLVDVRSVAAVFGGGGHPKAAGCEIEGHLDFAVAAVLPEVQKAIIAADRQGGSRVV